MGHHVFISYDRDDQTYARKLADDLRTRHIEVWRDNLMGSGDRWVEAIEEAIESSAAVVVVMTPEAKESEWVQREILLAQDLKKPIFPLLLRGRRFFILIDPLITCPRSALNLSVTGAPFLRPFRTAG